LSDNSTPNSWASASDDIILSANVFDELTNLEQPVFEARERVAFKGIGQYLDPTN
jgi:oligosaccharyltransferase complex subunit beta